MKATNWTSFDLTTFFKKNLIRKFVNLRIYSKKLISYDEIIRVELFLTMCLIAFSIGITYALAGVFLNISLLSIFSYMVFYLTAIPLMLFMVKKGFYNQAKLSMMIFGNIFMFIKASSLGRNSGMNLAMLIIIFGTFAFYSIKDYKYILLSLTIAFASITFLELTNYSYLGNDNSTYKYEYQINLVATLLFCILCFYLILRVNHYGNIKLSRLNNRLKVKNSKLLKINEELDSYIYKVSHDMRAPLTSMMGIIELIKIEAKQENINFYMNLLEKCIQKSDNHIHQIINLSKNIKTEVSHNLIDFKFMINEVFEELSFFEKAALTEKSIRINQNVGFYTDYFRLKVIFNNLISNAFKYAKSERVNHKIVIAVDVSPNLAIIKVTDNGIGIQKDQQSKIFDMFYRGTELSKGSGLGLYMVKEIILKLKGEISVNSEYNHTSFVIKIPNQHPI